MRKTLAAVVAAIAASIVVGVATPAMAATPATPSAPIHVQAVAHGATSVGVSWSAPSSVRPTVTGYSIAISAGGGQPAHVIRTLNARIHAVTFSSLVPGARYAFSVRAISGAAMGVVASASYTVTKPTAAAPSLWALDAQGALVRFPLEDGVASGTPITVASSGAGYAVDAHGDAFVPCGSSIVEYTADGRTTTLATGLHLGAALSADAAGDVFWFDAVSGAVDELAAGSSTATVAIPAVPSSPGAPQLAVGSDGAVSVVGMSDEGVVVTSRTAAGAISTRTVANTVYSAPIGALADGSGDLYLGLQSSGASGALSWNALPAGSSTLVGVDQRLAYDYAAANASTFSLLQSTSWCAGASEGLGDCTPDRSVQSVVRYSPASGATSTPISGLTTGGQYSRGLRVGAADAAGDVFVAVPDGPTAGLLEVPAAGGAVRAVSAAQYTRLAVG